MNTLFESLTVGPRREAVAGLLERLTFIGLLVLALSFAFELTPGGQTIADASLTNVKLLEIAVIGIWLVTHLAARSWPRVPSRLALPFGVWLAVLVISTALAPDLFNHTLRFMSRIMQGVLLAWIAYDLLNTPIRWRLVVKALVLAGLAVAILGLAEALNIQPVVNGLKLFRPNQTHVGDVVRISSSLEYATITAMVLEMLIPLTLAWALTARRRWLQAGLALGVLLEIVAMVLTLTRSALLGLLVALGVIAIMAVRQRQRSVSLAAIGTIGAMFGAAGLLLVFNPTVGLRLVSENESGWYQARYVVPNEVTAHPGESLSIPVQLTNAGVRPWIADAGPPFRLGYTLTHPDDPNFKPLDGVRTKLPADVPPNGVISLVVEIPVPNDPGQYLLSWDMVEETIIWFSWRGSPLGTTHLTVIGDAVADSHPLALPPANHMTASPPVDRAILWSAALHMFQSHPIFGVGPDNFRWLYGRYLNLEQSDTNIHANSIYFEWLADTGLIGLIVFLWLNGQVLGVAFRGLVLQPELPSPRPTYRSATPLPHGKDAVLPFSLWGSEDEGTPRSPVVEVGQRDQVMWLWQLALFASLIAWFVHGLLDNFYEFAATYILFWLIVGMIVNVATNAAVPGENESSSSHANRV